MSPASHLLSIWHCLYQKTQGKAFALLESVLVEHPRNTWSSCSTELGPCSTGDQLPPHTPLDPSRPGHMPERALQRWETVWQCLLGKKAFQRVWSAEHLTCMLTGRKSDVGSVGHWPR